MYLVMIGAAIVVLGVAVFTWPQPYFSWSKFFGLLMLFSFIMGLIVMFAGGVMTDAHSLYTARVSETSLQSTGDGTYVLASEDEGTYTFRTPHGPVTVRQGVVEIIPDEPARMIKTEYDTTKWALWPTETEYVLYVPSGGIEGLTNDS